MKKEEVDESKIDHGFHQAMMQAVRAPKLGELAEVWDALNQRIGQSEKNAMMQRISRQCKAELQAVQELKNEFKNDPKYQALMKRLKEAGENRRDSWEEIYETVTKVDLFKIEKQAQESGGTFGDRESTYKMYNEPEVPIINDYQL